MSTCACGNDIGTTFDAECLPCRHERHKKWEQGVRDPAVANATHIRLDAGGQWTTLGYSIAPIPSGWAWRAECLSRDGAGNWHPWTPVATEAEAHDQALAHLAQRTGQPLQGDLLGGTA